MLRKILFSSFIIFFLSTPLVLYAQTVGVEDVLVDSPQQQKVTPIISSEEFVQVDKKIIFDASRSVIPEGIQVTSYRWDFGDGFFEIGQEVVHQYTKIGTYDVTVTLEYNGVQAKESKSVFVYDRKAFLIIDSKKLEDINLISTQAEENGIALKVISPEGPQADFLSEDTLVKSINEEAEYIKDSSILIFYTKSMRGLQAFTRYWQSLNIGDKELLKNKFFVVMTDGNLDINAHGVFQNFKIIDPKFILLSRSEAFGPILSTKNTEDIETQLFARGIEYRRVDAQSGKSNIYALSRLVTFFIEKGLSADSVYLILVIPFLAFIVIFFRHVIGVSTFGVYTPVIIAVAFFIIGPLFGVLSFFFAVVTSYIVKYVFDKFDLLYLPKVALNLSFIALSFLLLMFGMVWFGNSASLSLAVFPMLVMSTLSEKFMAAKLEEGLHNAVVGVIQTFVVIIVCYYVMRWASFNNLLVSWPEVVLIPLLGTLLLGKFSGLRISEYFRFRSLFSDQTEE